MGHTDAAMLYLLVLANTVLVWLGLFYGRAQEGLLAHAFGEASDKELRRTHHPQRLLSEP